MAIRSTGIGLASGVGRSGAILAPIVIGTLVGMALPLQLNFVAIAVPAVIAAVAVALINQGRSASARPHVAQAAAVLPPVAVPAGAAAAVAGD
jgi:AAHS family benzoate transporter-like MFS transporter